MIIRIRVITGIVLLLALILLFRLYHLQVSENEFYVNKAERQYVHTKQDLYSRGSVFFTTRDGEKVSAASIRSGFLLAFNPTLITDPNLVCERLSEILEIEKDKCIEKASLKEKTYVEYNLNVSDETADQISVLDLDGVQLYRNQWRYYPGDDLAAKVIGFVGYTDRGENELHGKYGLERYYDSVLMREKEVRSVNFFAEIFSNLGDMAYSKDETPVLRD